MGIPINIPSLSELLAAYKTGSLTDGINAASTNFNNAARTASDAQAQRAQAATAQQQTAIQQQQANTTEQLRQSQIISPENYQAVTSGQAPSGPVNQTLLDAVMKQKAMAQEQQNAIASRESIAHEAQANREQELAIANQTHQAQIAATSSTAANAQLDTALKNKVGAHSWLPWETSNEKAANATYNYAAQRAGMQTGAATGPHGATVTQRGVTYTWNPSTQNYE